MDVTDSYLKFGDLQWAAEHPLDEGRVLEYLHRRARQLQLLGNLKEKSHHIHITHTSHTTHARSHTNTHILCRRCRCITWTTPAHAIAPSNTLRSTCTAWPATTALSRHPTQAFSRSKSWRERRRTSASSRQAWCWTWISRSRYGGRLGSCVCVCVRACDKNMGSHFISVCVCVSLLSLFLFRRK